MDTDLRRLVARTATSIRSSLHLSQEEAAAASGISREAVSYVERGAKLPTLDTLEALARGLGVPVTAFFNGLEERVSARRREDAKLRARFGRMGDREMKRLLELAKHLDGASNLEVQAAIKMFGLLRDLSPRDIRMLVNVAIKFRAAAELPISRRGKRPVR